MHPKYFRYLRKAYITMAADILKDVAKNGLTDESYYFISFDTCHPQVEMPAFLKAKYPKEMSIVLQHQFDNLNVSDTEFSVELTFGGTPATLVIPFEALIYFADPAQELALPLQFSFNSENANSSQESSPSETAEVIDLKSRFKK